MWARWCSFLSAPALLLGAAPDAGREAIDYYKKKAHDQFFNIEYRQSIASYQQLRARTPEDPNVLNNIAAAYLFRELHRLGKLESSAFKGDNEFLDWEKPEADPQTAERFRQYVYEARKLAESILEKSPRDREALYALAQNYGLEANYLFMIEKSYIAALRRGNKARDYSEKLIKLYPDFDDGYLIAGTQEYVVGSLPWVVKVLVAIGGISGDKEKGMKYVKRVAENGDIARDQARVLLTLLLRREKKPLEAAQVLEGLIEDFPRNYVLRTELGAMYEDADKPERALEVFRATQAKVENEEPGYGRMPERYRKALKKKIEDLEKALQESAGSTETSAFADPPGAAAAFATAPMGLQRLRSQASLA